MLDGDTAAINKQGSGFECLLQQLADPLDLREDVRRWNEDLKKELKRLLNNMFKEKILEGTHFCTYPLEFSHSENGTLYKGQGINNVKEGYGVLENLDGKILYAGYWQDNKYQGEGKLFNQNAQDLDGPLDWNCLTDAKDYLQEYQGTRGRVGMSYRAVPRWEDARQGRLEADQRGGVPRGDVGGQDQRGGSVLLPGRERGERSVAAGVPHPAACVIIFVF